MAENGNREFGDIGARLKIVEAETAAMRTKLHKQSQSIQANALYVTALKGLPSRVAKLEKWQYTMIGAALAAGAIGGYVVEYVLKKL